MTDHLYLRRAITLASEARTRGNPPFGSLLISADGVVLAEERNTSITDRDVTAHPELKLARWAARELPPERARATTMYTSCEPCAMCANVIARAGLGRVVYALSAEELQSLRPPGFVNPDAAQVSYSSVELFDEARVPVDGYYS
jgi:tRNA(Arg) A34 adenosine deaminase TadA